jgi:hypothetical protein
MFPSAGIWENLTENWTFGSFSASSRKRVQGRARGKPKTTTDFRDNTDEKANAGISPIRVIREIRD